MNEPITGDHSLDDDDSTVSERQDADLAASLTGSGDQQVGPVHRWKALDVVGVRVQVTKWPKWSRAASKGYLVQRAGRRSHG